MAISTNGIYAQAQLARMLSSTSTSVDTVISVLIDNAINTAVSSGLYTCTASMAGKAPQDIQNNMNLLKNAGYTVTLAGTTLTLSW
jgi:hypothetical protein